MDIVYTCTLRDLGVPEELHDIFTEAYESKRYFQFWHGEEVSLEKFIHYMMKHVVGPESSEYAWVDQKGRRYPVRFGAHDDFANIFLDMREEEAELKCAKIAYWTHTPEQAWSYVKNPSRHMKKAVLDHFALYRR